MSTMAKPHEKLVRAPANKRLKQELQMLADNPLDFVLNNETVDNNIRHWKTTIAGPKNTPYEGGEFDIEFKFKSGYPIKFPTMKMLTRIYHISATARGIVCLTIMDNWDGREQCVSDILQNFYNILIEPDPQCAIDETAFITYNIEREKYLLVAKQCTENFAMKNKKHNNDVISNDTDDITNNDTNNADTDEKNDDNNDANVIENNSKSDDAV